MDEQTARKLIVEIGKLMYDKGYVTSSDGNISYRLGENLILATPTQVSKGRMTEDMMALTDLDGNALNDNRVSSEIKMHLLIYKMRPDINAVCHAHTPHGTAFAAAGLAIDAPILSEVILTLGCVPLTAYGTPSTPELTDALKPYVEHHNALLLENHGVVAYGKDLWQAFDRLETLEHTAKIAILARTLGGANDLPPDAIKKLVNIREKAGYLPEKARCQSCGYLEDAGIACETNSVQNQNGGDTKISLTREELIELLSQAAR
ncbi:MAG: class II aldolase/adducin family protein [Pyrinomonadaceae bacterium]|nr:class II aldolase/adducin family protein [Pyrinomonadaceae bacterium]